MKLSILAISVVLLSLFVGLLFVGIQKNTDYYSIAKLKMEIYNPKRKDYVIVIDYTKNIFSDRLFVIDMKTGKIVIKSVVSHAFNSGILYPTDFSNISESYKSCKGNFITKGIRYGSKYGYAMNISGLDYSLNGNAKNRLIIFHSSKIMKNKWSNGCFATPEDTNKKIIDLTKNGCLVTVISE